MEINLNNVPDQVKRSLRDFSNTAIEACSQNLLSIVLFGSAAEGRMRATSDVNLILVLKEFDVSQIDRLRESLRVSHAAIRLGVMFILENEIPIASEAFAVKFTDILGRNQILFGKNPFQNLKVPRAATIQRLEQVVINLTLRLRERYALVSLREEQLIPIIADSTGPIRSCAATILELEGKKIEHPKEALKLLTQKLNGKNWEETLNSMSRTREGHHLPSGEAKTTLLGLLDLLKALHKYIQGMN